MFGAHQSRRRDENLELLAQFFRLFASLNFDDRAAEQYGRLRSVLAAAGTLIGPNDLMIASIALAQNTVLVTHNLDEFRRVPLLQIEDWQTA